MPYLWEGLITSENVFRDVHPMPVAEKMHAEFFRLYPIGGGASWPMLFGFVPESNPTTGWMSIQRPNGGSGSFRLNKKFFESADFPLRNFEPSCGPPAFRILEKGYGFTHKAETHSIALEGGASRYRRDFHGALTVANVSFKLGQQSYQYLMQIARSGQLTPIDVYLFLDASPVLTRHSVIILPDTVKISQFNGLGATVSCQVQIQDTLFDNVDWPAAL